jgi:hypothetical protein
MEMETINVCATHRKRNIYFGAETSHDLIESGDKSEQEEKKRKKVIGSKRKSPRHIGSSFDLAGTGERDHHPPFPFPFPFFLFFFTFHGW